MNPLTFRFATANDAPKLASFNQQLILDEGHRNPMNLAQLTERMSGWLTTEYQAVIFELGSSPVGYALFRRDVDYIYLRQLFVLADHRRQGVGRQAINWMRQNACPEKSRLRIDVLVGNRTAYEFWKSVGFQDYCITMELG